MLQFLMCIIFVYLNLTPYLFKKKKSYLKKKKNTWRRIKYFYGASDVEICLKKRLSEMG